MIRAVRSVIVVAGAVAASIPVALVLTILLFPFWSWIENTFGIESVGHSGPAGWCYLVTSLTVAIAAIAGSWRLLRRLADQRTAPK